MIPAFSGGMLGRAIAAILAAPRAQTNLYTEGDSIMVGTGSTTPYRTVYANTNGRILNALTNGSAGGACLDRDTVSSLWTPARLSARLAALNAYSWQNGRVLAVAIGTNDMSDVRLGNTSVSMSTYIARFAEYLDNANAEGWQNAVGTVPPAAVASIGSHATFETNRLILNDWIRSQVGTSRIRKAFDFASDPVVGSQASWENTTYSADGLHPTQLMSNLMAPIFGASINGLIGAATLAAPYTTWNPVDKAAEVTLSNTNHTIGPNTATATYRAGRGSIGRDSGKYFIHTTIGVTSQNWALGITNLVDPTSYVLGLGPNWITIMLSGDGHLVQHATRVTAIDRLSGYVAGDVLWLYVNFDLGYAWFAQNNDAAVKANVFADTMPHFTFVPNTMAWLGYFASPSNAATLALPVDASGLSSTPVTGYLAF